MTKPFFMARLAGTQAEMGTQHGHLVADDAVRLVEFYRTMPERALVGDMQGIAGKIGRSVARGLATAWQARLAKDRPAELAERSRAFMQAVLDSAPGAIAPRNALLTMATMDSLQNCVSLVARGKLGPFANPLSPRAAAAAMPACSTVIAWGAATHDGELMFSRNFDFPGIGVWDAAPSFVVCAPTGGQRYGFFATRGADAPVVTCVNEAGLVIAPHTRWHVGVKFGGAMIVDLIHDIARRAECLEDAIKIARERDTSSTWGIAVGSAREKSGLVLEIAGPSVEVVRPAPGASYLVCANRYRSDAMQAGQVAATAAWAQHSERRERRLRALVDARTAPLAPETLARFMGDRHDVEAPQHRRRLGGILAQPTNVHCVVVSPAAQRALVGVDRAPCCEGTWAELAWTWDGPTGGWEIGNTADTGFTAKLRTDVVAPHDAATLHVQDAARAYESEHDIATARASLDKAIALDPEEPSLRLAAAWLAYEGGAYDRAMIHVHAGLARETESYRRGQLLLWGSRAAQVIDPPQSKRWADDLAQLSGPHVEELKVASRQKYRRRPHVNLMMVDAY
ncbi:MAG TPA: carcinine hydrolase/isopenicillin-N N-acyltransferase family protein [Kofleriaceae bacterium]|nr:carcinine hydrolase/isopenicillin-N N-acyltransferase family protein [Kofleriaceae bacterium]